ncbi:hypothetical protein QQS21_011911 [Conoideocrella luteorostrata]|uniref:Uncharacterized protein n=1 Tax=Conoideocrella luteorostrata TaxID=1105319 RepID=A0AAJ0CGR3_9HYPO|nr:hypothetical protein QQS21_011911 [Conoideocrella luteorostrata]
MSLEIVLLNTFHLDSWSDQSIPNLLAIENVVLVSPGESSLPSQLKTRGKMPCRHPRLCQVDIYIYKPSVVYQLLNPRLRILIKQDSITLYDDDFDLGPDGDAILHRIFQRMVEAGYEDGADLLRSRDVYSTSDPTASFRRRTTSAAMVDFPESGGPAEAMTFRRKRLSFSLSSL